jgi:hypothetical protein
MRATRDRDKSALLPAKEQGPEMAQEYYHKLRYIRPEIEQKSSDFRITYKILCIFIRVLIAALDTFAACRDRPRAGSCFAARSCLGKMRKE